MRFRNLWRCVALLTVSSVIAFSADDSFRPKIPLKTDDHVMKELQQQALPDLIESISAHQTSLLRLVRTVGGVNDTRATAYLLQAYRHSSSEGVRCKLLETMGKIHDPSLYDFFVKRLSDSKISIRCYAIWALGELHTPQAIDVLLRKLQSPDLYIQMTAIDALGKTGPNPDVSTQLIVFLRTGDVQRRYLAASALRGVAGPENRDELFSHLEDERSIDVQEALAITLGTIGGLEGVQRFIALLNSSPSPDTEHWAEMGLEHAKPSLVIPSLVPLIEGTDIALKISALRVLAGLRVRPHESRESWVSQVEQWARSKDPDLAQAAFKVLKKLASNDEEGSHDEHER